MNFIGSDYRASSVSALELRRDATGDTIEGPRVDFNLQREQCPDCDKWFSDRRMLERHKHDANLYKMQEEGVVYL